jgi:diguanylate cyclase (GGDEF)-like protein
MIVGESRSESSALASALSREGHVTCRAADALEALGRIGGADSPDLVLLAAAPGEEGWPDALCAMKERVQPRFLPVIALTRHSDVAARVAALRAGADDVVARGCAHAEIAARVAAMLRIKVAQDALERARVEAERLSVTDALTGLYNRRYFRERLDQEIARARRYGESLSLLVLDLDHFKRVNDRYGHAAGDEALRLVAVMLEREVRCLDVCTRWGGEEFAIIMPNTAAAGAMVVARRLLRTLRTSASLTLSPISSPDGAPETVCLTASLGHSSYPSQGVDCAEALVRAADAAMYRAKNEGRDRICVVDPERGRPSGEASRLVPALATLVAH